MALKDFSIGTRVALLAALPVLGVLTLSAVHSSGDRAVRSKIKTAGSADEAELHAATARYLFASLRRHEKEFLTDGDIIHAERYRHTVKGLHERLAQLAASPLARPVKQRIEVIRELSTEHAADFEQIVKVSHRLGLEANAGLHGEMRRSAQAIEADIRGIQEGDRALLAQLLTLRRHEKNFIVRNHADHLEAFDDERTRFDWLIGTAKLSSAMQAALRSQLDTYQNTFRGWVQASHERNLHMNRLSATYGKADAELEAVFNHIDAVDTASRHELDRVLERVARTSLAISIGLLAFIMILAYFVARGIVQPLRTLTRTFGQLSDGNVDVRIDGQERNDEIGELSRTLADFQSTSTQALRSQATFEAASASIIITDMLGIIIATNQAADAMFRGAEHDLRRARPDFDINARVGQPVDLLVPGLIVDLERTESKQVIIGRRAFDLVITPIFSRHGMRLGAAIEWKDKTEQLATEEEVARIVRAASAGDFSQRLSEADKSGFMLELTQSMNGLIKTVELSLSEIVTMLAAMADGDVNKRMEGDYSGIFLMLKTDANRMSTQMRTMAERITRASTAVNSTTREIGTGVGDLSARTEQQASSLEETAASLEELSATVRQNAENAQAANQAAVAARERAAGGGKIAVLAIGAMEKIEESSRRITEIVALIEEIAFQTNILALNAAVEAARAGEAGRGFAVVANEVRALAQRSGQALKDVKSLIVNSDIKVKEGVTLVSQAGTSLTEIAASVKEVADLVSEIAAASREQSTGLDQVSRAVTNMDQMTQQNAALVEETNAALHSAQLQVDELLKAVEFFKIGTGRAESPPVFKSPKTAVPGQALPSPGQPHLASNAVHRQHQMLTHRIGRSRSTTETALPARRIKDDDWKEF